MDTTLCSKHAEHDVELRREYAPVAKFLPNVATLNNMGKTVASKSGWIICHNVDVLDFANGSHHTQPPEVKAQIKG